MKKFGVMSILGLILSSAYAANPILHTLNSPFPAEVSSLGGSVSATYTFTNNLPWTFTKSFRVNAKLCPVSPCTAKAAEFSYEDQCSGKKLKPKEKCTFKITLAATTPGRKSIMVSYGGYDNNTVQVKPALTTLAVAKPAALYGTVDYPSATPLPSTTFPNTYYTVIFSFKNLSPVTIRFTQLISQNNDPSHPNFTITRNTCIPTGKVGSLTKGAGCFIKGQFNSATEGTIHLSAQLIGAVSSNKLLSTTTVQSPSFNKLIGVDYNPNHYSSTYLFNSHDVFFTGTTTSSATNNPSATNVYAELQQLQNAGFSTVRSYQTEPYSWIDIIKQANALGMKVIYEAVIPQLPTDTNYQNCPFGAQNYIPCAQQTLTSIINEVGSTVFNETVILVFAGHENYCSAGDSVPPCNGTSNINYLTSAVSALQTTLAANGASSIPVGSAVVSGNLVTPSSAIATDMGTLISAYSPDAPLAFDPYPFQWGVTPGATAVWGTPLSTSVQLINTLAWDYIQVVGSTTPPALPYASGQSFYVSPKVLMAAETGWSTSGSTAGYACNTPGPCLPSVANAANYFQALYKANSSNFVASSGYNIGVLAFEAYDEPAKSGPSAEQFYGLFNANCVQKAAGMVPNNTLTSAAGCQGFTKGTLLTINGTIPPSPQAAFNVNISYPSANHPNIIAAIPANAGTSPNIESVTPWPQFLIYTGAVIRVSSPASGQVCTTTATAVTTSSITFSSVTCTQPAPSSMGCFGLGCQISNPF
ncbi:hypothetical protein [Legionella sp. km772]|uniref:hypothetical protein n=1 Tax=Legionella sp. km772 TaxID=2498111 RepID=UPI000F8E5312|nr:hypothetical protein [Legionella sp. km772]RUR13515.1 hypothetical protein ELY15_02100 [Legionella sp. km772]